MSKAKNGDLYVVETDYLCRVPRVKKYTGRLHKKGAMVVVRGFEKYLPPAVGRRFFVNRDVAAAFVYGWCEEKHASLVRQAEDVAKVIASEDILDAVYAESVPDVRPESPIPKGKKLIDLL